MSKRIYLFSIIIAVSLILAACGGRAAAPEVCAENPDETVCAVIEEGSTIKIGYAGPMAGDYSAFYDTVGSSATVQSNLDSHTGNTGNPHSVTAAQANADPAGSAATVQSNLDTHATNTGNPHQSSVNNAIDTNLTGIEAGDNLEWNGSIFIPKPPNMLGIAGLHRVATGRFSTQSVGNSWTIPNFLDLEPGSSDFLQFDGTSDFTLVIPEPDIIAVVKGWWNMGSWDDNNDDREVGIGMASNGVVVDAESSSMVQVKKDAAGTTVGGMGFAIDAANGTTYGPRIRDWDGTSTKRFYFLDFMIEVLFLPQNAQTERGLPSP